MLLAVKCTIDRSSHADLTSFCLQGAHATKIVVVCSKRGRIWHACPSINIALNRIFLFSTRAKDISFYEPLELLIHVKFYSKILLPFLIGSLSPLRFLRQLRIHMKCEQHLLHPQSAMIGFPLQNMRLEILWKFQVWIKIRPWSVCIITMSI